MCLPFFKNNNKFVVKTYILCREEISEKFPDTPHYINEGGSLQLLLLPYFIC